MSASWSIGRVKDFIMNVCEKSGIPEPEELKSIKLKAFLGNKTRRYLLGEVNDDDFLNLLELVCEECRPSP
jgi:hypothetical protein